MPRGNHIFLLLVRFQEGELALAIIEALQRFGDLVKNISPVLNYQFCYTNIILLRYSPVLLVDDFDIENRFWYNYND